jgi:hypothetical protein
MTKVAGRQIWFGPATGQRRRRVFLACACWVAAWGDGGCSGSPGAARPDSGDARASTDTGAVVDGPDAATDDGADSVSDASPDAGMTPDDATTTTPGPSVLMRSYDLQRTGANLAEATLRPSVITPGGFGKLFCKGVDDDIYGQILYQSGVDFGARGRHNVIYVVTMNDSVYAFDADDATTAEPLWQTSYRDLAGTVVPVPSSGLSPTLCNPYRDISRQVGITSTPAIDPVTKTMYLVARTLENDTAYVQRLHAISLTDGSERPSSPVVIDASVLGSGEGSLDGIVRFDPLRNNQRAGLLLHDGVVYIGFSSHCDEGPYHGWLLGYDARTLSQVVAYTPTPDGRQGGIWMAGAAPAVGADGSLYLVTGNGTADLDGAGPDHGQAFVRLMRQGASLALLDWFTPANYDFLEGQDRDLGSSGAVLIPGSNLLLGGNKDGTIYVLDRQSLGHFRATDNDQILQTVTVSAARAHIHGTPVYWRSMMGEYLYVMAEEDYLRQYQIVGGQLVPLRISQVRAPIDPGAEGSYTMPGGILALSAAGDQPDSGLLWVTLPVAQDANHAVVPGVLRVFDAADITGELWDSEQTPSRDALGNFAKFNPPTVVNGKAYVPTFSNQVCVYGKLN